METENNIKTETKKAKLIFRIGKHKTWEGEEKDIFISKLEGKIVYANLKFNLTTGVSYNCELTLSAKEKAYNVEKADKTPVTKATLVFKKGKRMLNEKTNDYVENFVSTFDGEIVIAPETLKIEPHKQYMVEMVLSPNGRAYIVEAVQPIAPAKAEIISHESSLMVEVTIDGAYQENLRFDCMAGDEKILAEKIWSFKQCSVADKDMVVSNYEATCRNLMQKHLSKIK